MLTRLLENTRHRVNEQQQRIPLQKLLDAVHGRPEHERRTTLAEEMRRDHDMAVIAEIKRASPSRGPLAPDLNPGRLAHQYQQAGATAISVLTEPSGFGGCLEDLARVREAVTCPVLRKDFILTPYQVFETAALGADLMLLIAAALTNPELAELHRMAAGLGLQCLLEVHDADELHRVLSLPLDPARDLVGINNRNLNTFQVSLDTTFSLVPQIPGELAVISESGIRTREQVNQLRSAGVRGVLVGESLVTAKDPDAMLRELRGETGP